MYNTLVKHANDILQLLYNDEEYIKYLELYKKEQDENVKKEYGKHLSTIRNQYGLNKNEFEKFINVQRKNSLHQFINADVVQKIASRVLQATNSCLFGKGKRVHYKKIVDLSSIEAKKNTTGIIFNKNNNTVKVGKIIAPIKVRKTDTYKQEALKNDIAYCRIIRKAHKNKMQYYVQIVLKGTPPKKSNRTLGAGRVGIDIGPSTIAVITNEAAILEPIFPSTLKAIQKKIVSVQQKMDKSRRATNPDNYNKDGTVKKGTKTWFESNHYKKLQQELRYWYHIKTCYLTEYQNRLVKAILSRGDDVATEDIDFISWARRSKNPTQKTDKTITINKASQTKTIHKCKRKKRFGPSITNNSPAKLITRLDQVLHYDDRCIVFLNTKKVKLSQYNHDTDEYIKVSLSTREKTISGQVVQRDCYSAFLAYNYEDADTINRDSCFATFDQFIQNQQICLRNLKLRGDSYPSCMGIN